MIDYNYVGIDQSVDELNITSKDVKPLYYMNEDVANSVPISTYIDFKYIRGPIDSCVVDYHVPGENRIIPNMTIDDLKRHLINGTLPGCLLLDINDTSRTVREAMLLEMEKMGFIYPKAVQHTAF